MKLLILSVITLSMTNAFAKHSDILLRYELMGQLNSQKIKERSPDSEKQELNNETNNTIPDTEQQEGPEQND